MNVIDLEQRFGKQYRITFDPAYDAKGRRERDPWYMQLPCRFGTIYPVGGDKLAVEVDYHPQAVKRLLALGLRLAQDGDQEKTFLFPLTRFEEVAAIVMPRKRRRLTEQQKAERRALTITWSSRRTRPNSSACCWRPVRPYASMSLHLLDGPPKDHADPGGREAV